MKIDVGTNFFRLENTFGRTLGGSGVVWSADGQYFYYPARFIGVCDYDKGLGKPVSVASLVGEVKVIKKWHLGFQGGGFLRGMSGSEKLVFYERFGKQKVYLDQCAN